MMLNTKNDLPLETRTTVVDELNIRLAEAIDLAYHAKQAHWNVKGMEFRSLHKLFDRSYETIDEYVDEIAERCAQLGGVVQGTIQAAVKSTTLEEYPLEILDGKEHVEVFADRMSHFTKNMRKCIDQFDELGDQVTSDLCTEVCSGLDELLWMVESHLKPERASEQSQRKLRKVSS